jgi:hypothetical protein
MAMELPRRLLDRLGRQLERLGQRLRRRVAPVLASNPAPQPLPPEDAHAVWLAHVAHLSPEAWSAVAAPVVDDTDRTPIALARGSSRVSAWPSRAPLPAPAVPTRQTVPSAMPSVPSKECPAPQARIDAAQQPLPVFPLHPTTEEGVRWLAPRPLPPVSEPAATWPVMADPVVSTPAAPDGLPAEAGCEAVHARPLPVIAHADAHADVHARAVPQPLAWPGPDPVSVSASRGTETFPPAAARPIPVPAPAPWPRLAPADSLHAPQWSPRGMSPAPAPAHAWPPAAPAHRWPSLPPRTDMPDDTAPYLPGRLIAHRHARLTAEQRG